MFEHSTQIKHLTLWRRACSKDWDRIMADINHFRGDLASQGCFVQVWQQDGDEANSARHRLLRWIAFLYRR